MAHVAVFSGACCLRGASVVSGSWRQLAGGGGGVRQPSLSHDESRPPPQGTLSHCCVRGHGASQIPVTPGWPPGAGDSAHAWLCPVPLLGKLLYLWDLGFLFWGWGWPQGLWSCLDRKWDPQCPAQCPAGSGQFRPLWQSGTHGSGENDRAISPRGRLRVICPFPAGVRREGRMTLIIRVMGFGNEFC